MKITHYIIPFLLMITASSCKMPFNNQNKEEPIHKVFLEHEKIQLEKYKMKLVVAGTPEEEKIDKIAIHYIIFKKMKIPEARALVVDSIEKLLDLINNDEEVRKKLKKHPITYKDLKYNIGFGTTKGDLQEPPYVAYVYLDEGILHYCYEDQLFCHFIDEEDYEEPYETALKIIEQTPSN